MPLLLKHIRNFPNYSCELNRQSVVRFDADAWAGACETQKEDVMEGGGSVSMFECM